MRQIVDLHLTLDRLRVLKIAAVGTCLCSLAVSGCDDGRGGDQEEDANFGEDDDPLDQQSTGGAPATGGTAGATGGAANGGGDSSSGGQVVGQTGGSGSGGTGAGNAIPAFVAQGHVGRTMVSCDDGRSWVYDQSNDVGDRRCWTGANELGCDHDGGAGRGLTSAGVGFFAMFGWGTPSTLRHSMDGMAWESRIEPTADEAYGGVAFLDGTLLAAGRTSKISIDGGVTWSEGIDTELPGWNVRRAGTAGSHFVIVGDANEVVLSEDRGVSWYAPDVLPSGCGADVQTNGGIAFGNGTILIVGVDGVACRSTDGGRTFEKGDIGGSASSHLVWSGTDFVVYGDGHAYRSVDGAEFTATPMMPALQFGPVAVSDSGTFVAIEGGWGDSVWYENQEFYRSEDGIHWEGLPASNFEGGHPMRTLAFGHLSASASCPAP